MHIVHILNRYSVTASAMDQIQISLKDGYKVSLITEKSELAPNSIYGGLEHIMLDGNYLSIRGLISLIKIIKEIKPTVLHSHHAKSGMVVAVLGRIMGIPTLIEDGAKRNNYGFINRLLFTLTEVLSNSVVFVSEAVKNSLSVFEATIISNDKISIIHYGIDVPVISDKSKRSTKNELGIDKNDTVISHTGRMIPVKNQLKIIDLFFSIHDQFEKPLKLIMVGEGPLKKTLQQRVEELGITHHVIFTGLLEREKVYEILAISNYFIMLSKTEGHSVSLLEAMAYGCIPIISSIDSFLETVNKENAVFINNLGADINWLTKKMLSLDAQDIKSYYNNRYSENKMMASYYELYKKIQGAHE